MGLFDFIKKDNDGKLITNTNMFTELTQVAALTMYNAKIISQPGLQFLKEDGGVFERFATEEINGTNIAAYRKSNPDLFILILAVHSFGVGAYTVLTQDKILENPSTFTKSDLNNLIAEFRATDPYELCLRKFGFPLDGNNKKVLDMVLSKIVESEKEIAGTERLREDNLKAMMQVAYNAGVTVGLKYC